MAFNWLLCKVFRRYNETKLDKIQGAQIVGNNHVFPKYEPILLLFCCTAAL